ncbi:MAG: amidohydrolase family protein, partial [Treponema sp.]|nr:amidohydrolase family protein [Treponema sp.]
DFESVVDVYREIYDESRSAGKPALRVSMQCGISTREDMLDAHLARGILSGAPMWDDPHWGTFLKMQAIKLFADGTLGGRTAWMRQSYRDDPKTRGFPVLDQKTLNHFVQKAAAGGMQVIIHAIGDAGIDASITAIENVTEPGKNPLRHGIIHLQITTPDLLERMARNKILALVQPYFLADDMYIVESRVGPKIASTSYAWGSLQKLGVPASYGTDAPVSDLNPLNGIHWAVMRQPFGDKEPPPSPPFYPAEKVDVYTAVDNYTEASAFSSFRENSLGRIAPGYFADLVFLDRDIFGIPEEDIHKARVLRTLCAGETVYNG